MRSIQRYLATLIGGCLVGYLPYAPGTWGSILAALFIYFFTHQPILYVVVFIILCALSVWSYSILVTKETNHDPQCFVIDEVLGMWVASYPLIVLPLPQKTFITLLVITLVLFRVLDIFKPGIIGKIDKQYPNVWGVLGDDLMAGVVVFFMNILFILDW